MLYTFLKWFTFYEPTILAYYLSLMSKRKKDFNVVRGTMCVPN